MTLERGATLDDRRKYALARAPNIKKLCAMRLRRTVRRFAAA
jgi:hypothetical protein